MSALLLSLVAAIMFIISTLLAAIQPALMRPAKVHTSVRLRQVPWCRPALLRSWVSARSLLSVLLVRWLLSVCARDWGWGPVLLLVLAVRLLWWWWWVLLLLLRVVVCVLWGPSVGRLLLLAAVVLVIAAVFRVLSLGAV